MVIGFNRGYDVNDGFNTRRCNWWWKLRLNPIGVNTVSIPVGAIDGGIDRASIAAYESFQYP